jgi:hypothetical protein
MAEEAYAEGMAAGDSSGEEEEGQDPGLDAEAVLGAAGAALLELLPSSLWTSKRSTTTPAAAAAGGGGSGGSAGSGRGVGLSSTLRGRR